MSKYNKIVCFDFDGTLINTPQPTTGKMEWEKSTGMSWLGRGWWGNPESLNLDVFYPPVNGWVYKFYEKYMKDPSAYVFMATGRLQRLRQKVLDVLKLHNITFKPSHDNTEGVYCNTGGDTFNFKRRLYERKIRENPNAEEFIIFDDRHDQLVRFAEWAKTQPMKITIIDILNKKEM